MGFRRLFESKSDPALGQIVRGHFDVDPVTGQHPDPVLAHLARGMGQNLVLVFQHDTKHRIGQQFHNRARKFQ